MLITYFEIKQIPAVLYGEPANEVWLFLHGKCGCKEEAAAFSEIACAKGYQVLSIDLPEHGARKERDESLDPWLVKPELQEVMQYAKKHWKSVSIRANSIGAYFSMLSFPDVERALLVSPILDLERLILDMMSWARVTEAQLQKQGTLSTEFGETLSWQYLCYVREHPIHNWRCPIQILYARQDNMTTYQTVKNFMLHHHVKLTVMESGEHWFHTPAQLAALQSWETENI